MAELANPPPSPRVTRAIGFDFDVFGLLTAVLDVAGVVLGPEFCRAFPPAVLEPRRVWWRIHQLMDCSQSALLDLILLHNPSVLNSLTAMWRQDATFFNELLWCIVTRRIFIRSQS